VKRTPSLLGASVALAAFAAGLVAGSGAWAQDKDRTLTLDVRDAPIGDTLRLVSKAFDLNIVFSPDVKGTVTLSFHSVGVEQALDSIVRITGHAWRRKGDIIEVYRPGEKEPGEDLSEERVFELAHVGAADIRDVVEGLLNKGAFVEARGKLLVVRDTPASLVKLGELLPSLDRADLARRPLTVRTFQLLYLEGKEAVDSVSPLLTKRGSAHPDAAAKLLVVEDTAETLDAVAHLLGEIDGAHASLAELSLDETARDVSPDRVFGLADDG
jgi:type II secretory pathway component GspD/PulD (secretin)